MVKFAVVLDRAEAVAEFNPEADSDTDDVYDALDDKDTLGEPEMVCNIVDVASADIVAESSVVDDTVAVPWKEVDGEVDSVNNIEGAGEWVSVEGPDAVAEAAGVADTIADDESVSTAEKVCEREADAEEEIDNAAEIL
jgi:hypothetical protein